MGTDTYKITQFADDPTLILDGSERTLLSALNTIEIFGTVSGLKMNKSKTKLIWIGRKKFSKEKINTNYNLEWGVTEFTFFVDTLQCRSDQYARNLLPEGCQ